MIPLYDPKWKLLCGGYKVIYNPSDALSRLEAGENSWDELWENLHHQGDIGEASYAVVPHLVRIAQEQQKRSWEYYSLVSTIEIERHRKSNPIIPEWLESDYHLAIQNLRALALVDIVDASNPLLTQAIIGVIALSKGLIKLGSLVSYLDESELDQLLEEQLAWSELYF